MAEPAHARSVWVRRTGPVLVVTLDRPDKRNAVDAAMSAELEVAFDELEADPALRVGILAGTGPVFCAGNDLFEGSGRLSPRTGEYGLIRRPRTKPVLAAVDGPALGGGFELVLACDLVVASRRASFALPEGTRGRVPAAGGLFRGADRLPRNVVVEMMLAGARLEAERAHTLGLVNRLVEPGQALAAAIDLALDVCGSAPTSTAAVLAALRRLDAEHEASGWRVSAEAQAAVSGTPERAEGTNAFLERRPPSWTPDRDNALLGLEAR